MHGRDANFLMLSKIRLIIVLLTVALIASNVWWAYRLLDAGVTYNYMEVALEDNKQSLRQALALLPVVARPGVTRAEILEAAHLPEDSFAPFEKEGFVWVGKIGLKFNEQGQLVEASRAWSQP